ncbi:TPR repeat region-containing protein [Mycolicibacterium setense]
MSALDGFYSTWSKARATFGEGTPSDGSHYDGSSSQLLRMKGMIESAAPDDRWQGTGSEAYAAANQEHAGVYAKLAELDKKMAAEVTNAANVVTSGRNQLNATKSWVDSMVASLPATSAQDRENKLIPIANQGISRVNTTVQNANRDMFAIGTRVTGIKSEYDGLTNQKFADDKKPGAEGLNEDKDGDGKPDKDDVHKRAEQDVQDALSGNKDAAGHVEDVLHGIKPGQQLSEEQGAYLSQMQAQQHGMSVERLREVHDQLGEHGDIISNSWQLMSNDDVRFPKTETTPEALDDPSKSVKGGFDQLPQSVQDSLRNAGQLTHRDGGEEAVLAHDHDLYDISRIVKDGDPALQTGTELDREMIRAADQVMDRYKDGSSNNLNFSVASVAEDIFEASGRDHQIIHDHLTGTHGDNGDNFLHDITRIEWSDDGKAAGSLLSWTNDTSGPQAEIAGATARTYAEYIGNHPELMNLAGHHTLGQMNPHLVQGMAEGLAPYVNNIAGTEGGLDTFQRQWMPEAEGTTLDAGGDVTKGTLPEAKGVFSILNTDPEAAKIFNGAAYGQAVLRDIDYAQNPSPRPDPAQLYDSATLRALVDVGTHNAFEQFRENKVHIDTDEYTWKSTAYDCGIKAFSGVAGVAPGGPVNAPFIDFVGSAIKSDVLGPQPADPTSHPVPRLAPEYAQAEMLNTLQAVGHPISGVPSEFHANNDPHGRILTSEEMQARGVTSGTYQDVVGAAIDATLGYEFQDDAIKDRYDQVAADAKPQES